MGQIEVFILWKVKLAKVPLVEGQAEYSFASDSENFPEDIRYSIRSLLQK